MSSFDFETLADDLWMIAHSPSLTPAQKAEALDASDICHFTTDPYAYAICDDVRSRLLKVCVLV